MRHLEHVAGELEPVHVGHVDVGQHEVDGDRLQELDRLAAVLRLADDGERQRRGAVIEKFAQTAARGRLVVDDQDTERDFSHGRPPDVGIAVFARGFARSAESSTTLPGPFAARASPAFGGATVR